MISSIIQDMVSGTNETRLCPVEQSPLFPDATPEARFLPLEDDEHPLRAFHAPLRFRPLTEGEPPCVGQFEVHLLNVQQPLAGVNIKLFISLEDLNAYYHDEGMAALKSARETGCGGIQYAFHIGVGDPAQVIVQYAEDQRCEEIIVGSRGMGTVSNLVLGSVASKVIHLAKVPVLIAK